MQHPCEKRLQIGCHQGWKLSSRQSGRFLSYRGNGKFRLSSGGAFPQSRYCKMLCREELTTVACVLMSKQMKGKNMAIITHAGGPAVMLTDALEIRWCKYSKYT